MNPPQVPWATQIELKSFYSTVYRGITEALQLIRHSWANGGREPGLDFLVLVGGDYPELVIRSWQEQQANTHASLIVEIEDLNRK